MIIFIFPFICILMPVLPSVLWGLWPTMQQSTLDIMLWLFGSASLTFYPTITSFFVIFVCLPPSPMFSSWSTKSTHKYRYIPCAHHCTQMLLFLYTNTTCFLHLRALSSSELSCWMKFGSFCHDSSLQLKAKFRWSIRNWLFDKFIDFLKRKFTERLSPFRLTSLSLFLYGCGSILLAGTVPGGTFLPCQEFGFTSPRKKKRWYLFWETSSLLFLPNLLFHLPLRMILNSATCCQFSLRMAGSTLALNDRLLLGLYNWSSETEER